MRWRRTDVFEGRAAAPPRPAAEGLSGASRGSRWRLLATTSAQGGQPAGQRLRLAHSGLRPGAEVMVLTRTVGGGGVLAVGTYRLALDRPTLAGLRAEPIG